MQMRRKEDFYRKPRFHYMTNRPNPRKTVSVYNFSRAYLLITLNLIRLIYAQQ